MTVDPAVVVDRLFELAAILTDHMNRRLADAGLTPARGQVVWLIHHHGQMTHRRLSDLLDCTARNVTALVDPLEDAGLVARTRHPTDRRAVLVSLTPAGTRLTAGWSTDRDSGFAHLFAGTSDAERASFAAVLDHVLGALKVMPGQGDAGAVNQARQRRTGPRSS